MSRKLCGNPPGTKPKWVCFSWDPSGNFLLLGSADGRVALYMDLNRKDLSMQCFCTSHSTRIKDIKWNLPKNAPPTVAVLHVNGCLSLFEIGLRTTNGQERMVLTELSRYPAAAIESLTWSPDLDKKQLVTAEKKGRNGCKLKAWEPLGFQQLSARQIPGGILLLCFTDKTCFMAARTPNCLSKMDLDFLVDSSSRMEGTKTIEKVAANEEDGKQNGSLVNGNQLGEDAVVIGTAEQAIVHEEAIETVHQPFVHHQSDALQQNSIPAKAKLAGRKRKIAMLGSAPMFADSDVEIHGAGRLS